MGVKNAESASLLMRTFAGLLAFVGFSLTANHAVAQSTDSCELVSGTWYKYGINGVTYGGQTNTIRSRDALEAASLPTFCSYNTQHVVCGSYSCGPLDTYMAGSGAVGSTIYMRYVSTASCIPPAGNVFNANPSQVFYRVAQSNPAVSCPATGPLTVKAEDRCTDKAGNPCSPTTGTKYADETDYVGAIGFKFQRSYSTSRTYPAGFGPINPAFGSASWLHTYERSLRTVNPSVNNGINWVAQRHDGSLLYFRINGTELLNTSDTAAASTVTTLPTNGGWELRLANGDVERYSIAGRLVSITSRAGLVTTVTYNSNQRVLRVVNSFGHDLDFFYDAQNRLNRIRDPANGNIYYAYDANGRLEYVTYQDSTVRRYHYEHSIPELLTGITDENSVRFATYDYDSQGRAISTEHAGGVQRYEFSYTGSSPPYSTDVEDPLGTTRTYTATLVNNVIKRGGISGPVCNTCSGLQQTTYDSNGNVASKTDFAGNVTTYTFSSPRNLETSRTEAYGTARARTITTQWHSTYRLPTQIDEPGRRTTYTHDANGNVLTKTVLDTATSESRTWTYTYNSFGKVLTENGPRTDVSDVTTFVYYSCSTGTQCGQLNTITNALSQVTTFNTYNTHGQPLTFTDPNGVATTMAYDARQRLTSRTVAGEQTNFTYWPTGQLKRVTQPDGSYIEYEYDNAHRLVEINDNEGNRIVYTLDAMGNRTSEEARDPSNALARSHARTFNALNQLLAEIGSAGTSAVTTDFAYDDNGNLTNINAPLGRDTVQVFDEHDRLVEMEDPASGNAIYDYNSLDEVVSVTDPRGLATSYNYNALGDLEQQVSPDTGTTDLTYDSGGNIETSTDARNETGTYDNDALNRVTSRVYDDQTITYTYDSGTNGKGHLTGVADNSGSTSWTYTAHGRVATRTQVVNGLSRQVAYGYDSAGRLSTVTYPSGVVVTYGYTAGKVSSVTSGSETFLSNVLYDPFGPVRGWTWGNSTQMVRTYDLDGNIDQLDSGGLKTYAQDDAFRITGITDTADSSKSWTYGYDLIDRLTAANKTGVSQGWTYDANGNRLSQTGTAPSSYTIAEASNRLSSVTGSLARSYSYDSAGNVSADGVATFAYDAAGRMVGATKSGTTTTYSLNALGQRVRKTTAGVSTIFVYDEAGHLLGEYASNGDLIREYVWFGDIPISVVTAGPDTPPYYYWYIHTDHLNTPRSVERSLTGQLVWRWDSAPFGETAPNEDPDGDSTSFSFPLRFPGQYADQETGLNYNWNRDYDSATDRYVQFDPIGLRGGINGYIYGNANPLRYVDAKGLQTEALLPACAFGGPYNPVCDFAVIVTACKWLLIVGGSIAVTRDTGNCEGCLTDEPEEDPLPPVPSDSDPDKCKKARTYCAAKCSSLLPDSDLQSMNFQACYSACLASFNCLGKP